MKFTVGLMCGMMATAGLVYAANSQWGLILIVGFLLGGTSVGLIVCFLREHFLPTQISHHIHEVPVPVVVSASRTHRRIHVNKDRRRLTVDERVNLLGGLTFTETESDAVSALKSLGMSKRQAEGAVRTVRVKEGNGEGKGLPFNELMHKCLEVKRG